MAATVKARCVGKVVGEDFARADFHDKDGKFVCSIEGKEAVAKFEVGNYYDIPVYE